MSITERRCSRAGCRFSGSVRQPLQASRHLVRAVLRLALLAPDIVEAILGGWADQRVMLERMERPLPVGWEEQRAALWKGQPDDSKSGRSGSPHLLAKRRGRLPVSAGCASAIGRFVKRRTSRSLPG